MIPLSNDVKYVINKSGGLILPLQRESVARTALQVLDEVGLDGLTMRRLAAELEIQNPSLYSHFTSKQELLDCMAALMIADGFADLHAPRPDQDWDDWLAEFAHLFRRIMLGHRDGARILAEADVSLSNFFVGLELALEVLQRAGFDPQSAAFGVVSIIHFALGTTFQAQADPAGLHPEEADTRSHAMTLSVDEERFPMVAALLHANEVFSLAAADALFEAGLSLILEGLRASLAKQRPLGAIRETSD